MSTNNLGQDAHRVVEELAVRIGPRPAGSAEERCALDYLTRELQKSCADVRRTPVTHIPVRVSTQWLLLVGGGLLVYCTYRLVESPQAMLTFLAAFFVLPKAISWARQRASATSELASENVQGYQPASGERRGTVVLCAHLDSAKASRVPGELLPRVNRLLLRALVPFIFLMSMLAALRWLDLRLGWFPFMAWRAIRAAGLVFPVAYLLFEACFMVVSRGKAFSPGANDNASGVGVVLALANHFRSEPLAYLDVCCLLFTAEELGLIGSQQWVRSTDLDKKSTYVINLDMVGSGTRLCYITGSELLPPRFTDHELNTLFKQVQPNAKGKFYWMGNSDFHPFLVKGYRAASLDVTGDARADTVYHTERDVIDYVSAEALQLTADAVRKVIRLLDERIQ